MTDRNSTADFIKKAIAIHGDNYDYSNSIYINSRTKIKITCTEHGDFLQLAKSHLQGYGCKECGKLKVVENNKKQVMVFEDFEQRASKKHNHLFSYSKDRYVKAREKVGVHCQEHGWFYQKGVEHLRGKGCPDCSKDRLKIVPRRVVRACKEVHDNKYDYGLVVASVYLSDDILIICREHGQFSCKLSSHLKGFGCFDCAKEKMEQKRKELDEKKGVERINSLLARRDSFICKANDVHSGRYSYEDVVYKDLKTNVIITCALHGEFNQRIERHLAGRGCPQCGADESCGWSRSSYIKMCKARSGGRALLYVVTMHSNSESFIKIGITHKSIKERFCGNNKIPYDVRSLYIIEGTAGYIFDLEKRLHKIVARYRYQPNIRFGGHTECFTTIKPIEKLLKKLASTEQIQLTA